MHTKDIIRQRNEDYWCINFKQIYSYWNAEILSCCIGIMLPKKWKMVMQQRATIVKVSGESYRKKSSEKIVNKGA